MATDSRLLALAIDEISSVPGLEMPPKALVEDIVLLARIWPEEAEFLAGIASTKRALVQLAKHQVLSSPLHDELAPWRSYHFQACRRQGERAVLRIIFQPTDAGIKVLAFGHRFCPTDIYDRILDSRL